MLLIAPWCLLETANTSESFTNIFLIELQYNENKTENNGNIPVFHTFPLENYVANIYSLSLYGRILRRNYLVFFLLWLRLSLVFIGHLKLYYISIPRLIVVIIISVIDSASKLHIKFTINKTRMRHLYDRSGKKKNIAFMNYNKILCRACDRPQQVSRYRCQNIIVRQLLILSVNVFII